MAKVTQSLGTHLNADATQIFENQKEIEKETKQYLKTLEEFKVQSSRWIELSNEFNTALKELGDIENWETHINKEVDKIVSYDSK